LDRICREARGLGVKDARFTASFYACRIIDRRCFKSELHETACLAALLNLQLNDLWLDEDSELELASLLAGECVNDARIQELLVHRCRQL